MNKLNTMDGALPLFQPIRRKSEATIRMWSSSTSFQRGFEKMLPANYTNTRLHNRKRAAVPKHSRPLAGIHLKLYWGSYNVSMERCQKRRLFQRLSEIAISTAPKNLRRFKKASTLSP